MLVQSSIIFIAFGSFCLTSGYLSQQEANSLEYLYDSFNGQDWTICNWNFSYLRRNDTIKSHYCGLTIDYIDKSESKLQTVRELRFNTSFALNGIISPSIGNLSNLEVFYIDNNAGNIDGTIPTSICLLTKLIDFHLQLRLGQGLHGNIPLCISQITTLKSYYVGPMNNTIMNTSNLEYLCLYNAKPQEFEVIYIYNVYFNGSIPDCIGEKFLNLIELYIASNSISGIIPPNLFSNMTKLESFTILGTNIHGMLPYDIGKISTLEKFYITEAPNIEMNTKHIEIMCKYIPSNILQTLNIQQVNYTGIIPDCLKKYSNHLYKLVLEWLPGLTGNIPKFIFENFTSLGVIGIWGNSQMEIDFNFSDVICGNKHFNTKLLRIEFGAKVNDNYNYSLTIPDCVNDWNIIDEFSIYQDFHGTIPTSLCHATTLEILIINNTQLTGQLPNCLTNLTLLKEFTILNNQHIDGTIPKFTNNNDKLELIRIRNNSKITGSILDKLIDINLQNLQLLLLDNNNFVDYNNVETFFTKLFNYSAVSGKLKAFSLFGNKRIYGKFPNFENTRTVYAPNLQVFAIQNLDIYGQLPNNLLIGNSIKYERSLWFDTKISDIRVVFVSYGNQLSGKIPDNMYNCTYLHDIESLTFEIVLILNNMFTIENINNVPKYLKQDCDDNKKSNAFLTAQNLYLNQFDFQFGIAIFVISSVVLIIITIMICFKRKIVVLNEYILNHIVIGSTHDSCFKLLENIHRINMLFLDVKLLILVFGTFVFYHLFCNYYTSTIPIEDQFSLYFYRSNENYQNIMLFVIMISFNVIFVFKVKNLIKDEKYQIKDNNDKHSQTEIHNPNLQLLQRVSTIAVEKDEIDIVSLRANTIDKKQDSKLKLFIKFVFYVALYILTIFLTVLYFLFNSLPNNNILHMDNFKTNLLIDLSMAIALSTISAIILPNFVNICLRLFNLSLNKFRNHFIMMHRTFLTIILPFIISVLLLSQCGNLWVKFWNECKNSKSSANAFDITSLILPSSVKIVGDTRYPLPFFLTALESSQVCTNNFGSLNINTVCDTIYLTKNKTDKQKTAWYKQ